MHSNLSFNEQDDHQPNGIHEESHPNLLYEECNEHAENCVSNIFKEYFSMHIYDEREDGHLDDAPKEPTICNHGLDHLEETEGPKWDVSSCFPNSEC